MHAVHELPPITITTRDFDRLVVFGLDAYLRGDRRADFLLSELKRATLCPPRALPGEVVSVHRWVHYRLNDDPTVRGQLLVHPHDLTDLPGGLSVASPLGTALLGLRVGDRMPFRIDDAGIQHVVAVVGIGRRFSDEPVRGRGAPAPREA
ncbi:MULTISPECIES: GreA/GreB family elongation factor [Methylobacterium]|uniref:GreA/GreB family elongation factor n=1 Tax=Methylobacterium TaxID=407 RepID=UPI00034AC109|nr:MULTISPECIES: GreA/GreB family elongation factor [Methylobacterium]MBN4098284.1 GreA/GreB family elongation factor [Methylobacterium sp. OT2]ONF50680.1 elongation factor GreAB [Methylobacterium radiotolerans]